MIGFLSVSARRSSLEPLNEGRPDCLLPVLGKPLLAYTLSRLSACCEHIYVVADTDIELIRAALPPSDKVTVLDSCEALAVSADSESLCYVSGTSYMTESDWGRLIESGCESGGVRTDDGQVLVGLAPFTMHAGDTSFGTWIQSLFDGAQELTGIDVLDLRFPWNLIEANVAALRTLEDCQAGATVEAGVTLVGDVHIGAGSRIKAGTYIEGPAHIGENCIIGPSAYIRPDTVIGDDVTLGHAVEIFDSVVFEGVVGKHRSYIGHSVIGSRSNIGCGFVTSDYRHDGATHMTVVDGQKHDSGRRKLGAFLGDEVKTGVHTSVYPGRKIWGQCTTLPGAIVEKDVRGAV